MVCFCFDYGAWSVRILGASAYETRWGNNCASILVVTGPSVKMCADICKSVCLVLTSSVKGYTKAYFCDAGFNICLPKVFILSLGSSTTFLKDSFKEAYRIMQHVYLLQRGTLSHSTKPAGTYTILPSGSHWPRKFAIVLQEGLLFFSWIPVNCVNCPHLGSKICSANCLLFCYLELLPVVLFFSLPVYWHALWCSHAIWT